MVTEPNHTRWLLIYYRSGCLSSEMIFLKLPVSSESHNESESKKPRVREKHLEPRTKSWGKLPCPGGLLALKFPVEEIFSKSGCFLTRFSSFPAHSLQGTGSSFLEGIVPKTGRLEACKTGPGSPACESLSPHPTLRPRAPSLVRGGHFPAIKQRCGRQ